MSIRTLLRVLLNATLAAVVHASIAIAQVATTAPDPAKLMADTKSAVQEAAVEKIAAGLSTPRPEDPKEQAQWRAYLQDYLRMAAQFPDKRLVKPLIAIYDLEPSNSYTILNQLGSIDDPLVTEFCVVHLDVPAAANIAVKRLGAEFPATLGKLAAAADTPKKKITVASNFSQFKWVQPHEKMQQVAIASLLPMLDDSNEVAAAAIAALAAYSRTNEGRPVPEVVGPMLEWIKHADKLPRALESMASSIESPEVCDALLVWYRQHRGDSDLYTQAWIIRRLGAAKYAPAYPDLMEVCQKAEVSVTYGAGIYALANVSDEGAQKVFEILKQGPSQSQRTAAALALGSAKYRPAFEEARKLCEDIRLQGAWSGEFANFYFNRIEELSRALLDMDGNAAMPYVKRLAIDLADEPTRHRISGAIQQAMLRDRDVRDAPASPPFPKFEATVADADLPTIPELEVLSLWRAAAEQQPERESRASSYGTYRRSPPGGTESNKSATGPPVNALQKLVESGPIALEALIEIFYPESTPLTPEEVDRALHDLSNANSRSHAVIKLATRFYRADVFDSALTKLSDEPRAQGEAIRKWRGVEVWPARVQYPLSRAAMTALETLWPLDQLQASARAHLDRLAVIKKGRDMYALQPMTPILASLRYSRDRQDLEALANFIATAEDPGAIIGLSVMRNGIAGRSNTDLAPHWKTLPPELFPFDYAAMLDPKRPEVFKQAMYCITEPDRSVCTRLRAVINDPATDNKLRETVRSYLWSQNNQHGGGNPEDEKYYANNLDSKDPELFRIALDSLVRTRPSYQMPYQDRLIKILGEPDSTRRALVINRLWGAGSQLGDALPTFVKLIAPFMTSAVEMEQKYAVETIRSFEQQSPKDILAPVIDAPATPAAVREIATKIRSDCDRLKQENEQRSKEWEERRHPK